MQHSISENSHILQSTANFAKIVVRRYPAQVALISFSLLLAAFLEILGIGALIPIILHILGQGAAMPEIIQRVLDFFNYEILSFSQSLAILLILMCARGVMVFISFAIIGWISTHIEEDLRRDMMRSYLEASWPYHLKAESAAFINGIMTQTNQCAQAIMQLGHVISATLMASFLIAASLTISFTTFFIFTLSAIPYILFSRLINSRMRKISIQRVLVSNECASEVMSSYHLKKYIKASSLEAKFYERFSNVSRKLQSINTASTTLKALISTYPEMLGLLTIIILIAFLQSYDLIAPENLVFFILLLYRAYSQIGRIQTSRTALISYIPSFSLVSEVLADTKKYTEGAFVSYSRCRNVMKPMHIVGRNVSVRYSDERSAVHNIDFEIKPNALVAIVGRSGAGKTTLADTLMGLLTLENGEIRIDDGTLLQSENLRNHRSRIGYVPQDPCLISGSVKDNILLGAEDQSEDNMRKCAEQAMVTDFVNTLSEGFDTYIGDKGISLSGGQKQRIALARALARKPDLLILDEATSALDNETEKMIHEAISSLREECTILVIAHRLTTVKTADLIYVMDQGKIVQSGCYDALMKEEGVFQKLYRYAS